jgi:hypothetical protein
MRALLILLLCLTIPFQGVAASHAFKAPCPMEQMGHAMAMDDGDLDRDCCNDPVTAAKTGQLCKVGQECPTGGIGILVRAALAESPGISSLTISFPPTLSPSPNLSSIWRPPALI